MRGSRPKLEVFDCARLRSAAAAIGFGGGGQSLLDDLVVRHVVRTVFVRYRWNLVVKRFVGIGVAP
jgi:hypothetical protein